MINGRASQGNGHEEEIKEYLTNCQLKTEYHKSQAKSSLAWHNLLGIFSVILTAGQALLVTALSIYKSEENTIAITSSTFAFIIAVFNRVQSAYSFNLLALQHNNAFDDYNELLRDFSLLDSENFDLNTLRLHIHRYTGITEKSHHQHVRSCVLLECFC